MKLIQSISRAFDIINCFNEEVRSLKLKELSDKVELNINTTRGIVNTLLHYGYLEHNESKNEYSLGHIFIAKSNLTKSSLDEIAMKVSDELLSNLSNEFLVTSRLHLVKDKSILKLLSKESQQSRYVLHIKDSIEFPLNATSSGKLILKYSGKEFLNSYIENTILTKYTENTLITKESILESLQFIEENNYSLEIEEVGLGISSLALPVLIDEKLEYTVSVSGPTSVILDNKGKLIEKLAEIVNVLLVNIKGNNI